MRSWVAAHLSPLADSKMRGNAVQYGGMELPFSFTLGGRQLPQLAATWGVERTPKEGNAPRIAHAGTWRNQKAGLVVRFEAVEYADFPTVEFLGNTGSAALPVGLSLAAGASHDSPLRKGDYVALLGIGSGLVCANLGVKW